MEIVIDGENAILGRISSFVAKEAMKGKNVVIVNSKKIIISGNFVEIKEEYMRKRRLGGSSRKGIILSSIPEKMLKKTIKGMLPSSRRGVEALMRVRCYNDVPEKYVEVEKIKSSRNKGDFNTLEKVSKLLK
ncbi:MAG: uL13 family ribosomal protein [Nanoarchaeota archaeon]|nr:uL13 family ribosomal protein [Nanoarchaeota archaeon]